MGTFKVDGVELSRYNLDAAEIALTIYRIMYNRECPAEVVNQSYIEGLFSDMGVWNAKPIEYKAHPVVKYIILSLL